MKTEITMYDLNKAGMSDALFRHFSDSDYSIYQTAEDEFSIYIGRDLCQTFASVADVIASFEEIYAEDTAEGYGEEA